jgi:hypothetical protein
MTEKEKERYREMKRDSYRQERQKETKRDRYQDIIKILCLASLCRVKLG